MGERKRKKKSGGDIIPLKRKASEDIKVGLLLKAYAGHFSSPAAFYCSFFYPPTHTCAMRTHVCAQMVRYLQNHPLVFKRQKGNSWIITKDIVRKYACDKLRVAIPRERLQMPEEGFTDFGEYRVPVQVAESHPASLLINVVPR